MKNEQARIKLTLNGKNMTEFIELAQKIAPNINPEKMYLVSPGLSLITYRIDIGIETFAVHEERHFLQAMRVLNHPSFPKD
ncbi:MAG: hypothetical protein NZ108_04685 [Bacteroidia bacterium]|nr:hypothetical protein [Bacteroidia bacterium]